MMQKAYNNLVNRVLFKYEFRTIVKMIIVRRTTIELGKLN